MHYCARCGRVKEVCLYSLAEIEDLRRHLSTCLLVYLSTCLPVYMSTCLRFHTFKAFKFKMRYKYTLLYAGIAYRYILDTTGLLCLNFNLSLKVRHHDLMIGVRYLLNNSRMLYFYSLKARAST